MDKGNQVTVRDYLFRIYEILGSLEHLDKENAAKIGQADECCKEIWMLLGFAAICRWGELPGKG